MAAVRRQKLILAAVVCSGVGAAAWIFYILAFARSPGQEWLVFYNAARLVFEGKLAALYDSDRFTAIMDQRFGMPSAGPHPWLYPPNFLLLLVPFGVLSFAASLVLFLGVTFGAVMAAFSTIAVRGRQLYAASLILSPAAVLTVCLGQNAFLTGALLVGGFGMLVRRPIVAGALLGLATYKPQLWLIVPIALIAGRSWKALASALATGALFAAASVAAFGIRPWIDWISLMTGSSDVFNRWPAVGMLKDQSGYACIVMLGCSPELANLLQIAAALAAAGAVWWIYSRPAPKDLRLAVLLSAALLATPHVMVYDAVLLVIAATILFAHGLEEGFRPGELAVTLLAWTITAAPPSLFKIGVATPLLILALIGAVLLRVRATGSVRAALPA